MNKILYLAALLALSSCDGGKVAVYKEGPEGATCEWIERGDNPFDCIRHFSYDTPALKAHSFRGGMKTQTDASR